MDNNQLATELESLAGELVSMDGKPEALLFDAADRLRQTECQRKLFAEMCRQYARQCEAGKSHGTAAGARECAKIISGSAE